MPDIQIDESWEQSLLPEFELDYMAQLWAFLAAEKAAGKQIFPPENEWFRALELTPLDNVRAVIVGQDPYPGAGKAHGLSFSVRPSISIPMSLRNVYKELESDLGIPPAKHGYLEHWAQQGVLLLNDILTVEQGKPMAHKNRGWERFTKAVLALVNARETPTVFLLWGDKAKAKAEYIDDPSSMGGAVYKGFFGCRHFSKCNAFLESKGLRSIDWALPEAPLP
jgi:uracil-DNA glycosylase